MWLCLFPPVVVKRNYSGVRLVVCLVFGWLIRELMLELCYLEG
jgi:hypothetical protein